MTVHVSTDAETDRLLSLRASAQIPLPPEIALSDPGMAGAFFDRRAFYTAYGLRDHPVVRLLERASVDSMMASALARASHLDRVSHYGAWLGNETVVIEDLTAPTRDDPEGGSGRASDPPQRRSPTGGSAARPRRGPTPLSQFGRQPDAPCADGVHPEGPARRDAATNRPRGRGRGSAPAGAGRLPNGDAVAASRPFRTASRTKARGSQSPV